MRRKPSAPTSFSPLFFHGGDIGSLVVHGTLNDLAMGGAQPLFLSVAFIIEEGLSMATLQRVVIRSARRHNICLGCPMHEMGIANSVLEKARNEVCRFPGTKLLRVGVCIGEWSGVEPESLRFCFESLAADTGAPPPALDIEFCLRRNRCPHCGCIFRVEDYLITCPECGETNTVPFSGDELQITYIDLEES